MIEHFRVLFPSYHATAQTSTLWFTACVYNSFRETAGKRETYLKSNTYQVY